jgi:hypothetical protein
MPNAAESTAVGTVSFVRVIHAAAFHLARCVAAPCAGRRRFDVRKNARAASSASSCARSRTVFANLVADLVERLRRRNLMPLDPQHEHVIFGELDELGVAPAGDDFLGERRLHDGRAVVEGSRVARAGVCHQRLDRQIRGRRHG